MVFAFGSALCLGALKGMSFVFFIEKKLSFFSFLFGSDSWTVEWFVFNFCMVSAENLIGIFIGFCSMLQDCLWVLFLL